MSYKNILVAVDLSDSSRVVINKAVSMAKESGGKLSFVYVAVDKVVMAPKEEQECQQKLQELAGQCDYPVTDTMVVIGDLHIRLSGLVKKSGFDLVVCGHHHKVSSRLFSSVPKMVNAVEADLLVVHLADD